jgi:hypothetical protein
MAARGDGEGDLFRQITHVVSVAHPTQYIPTRTPTCPGYITLLKWLTKLAYSPTNDDGFVFRTSVAYEQPSTA